MPFRVSIRMMSQTWLRLRGSRPVVGSSRNRSSGVTTRLAAMSSRRRMPPEKALTWRCVASASPKAREQFVRSRLRLAAAIAEEPAEEDEVLVAGEVLVDRGELPGEADPPADRVGIGDDVEPEHARRLPPSGLSSVASTRTIVVLPAPFGPRRP